MSPRAMILRRFVPSDAEVLAEVYRDAVREIAPRFYTPEQVNAWALYPEDMNEFSTRLARGITLITEMDGHPIAFGQLEPADHLMFLYCAAAHCRRGIGATIYTELEEHALKQAVPAITTDASRISRPFFEKHGYTVLETEHVVRFGVEFERFKMRKVFKPSGRGDAR